MSASRSASRRSLQATAIASTANAAPAARHQPRLASTPARFGSSKAASCSGLTSLRAAGRRSSAPSAAPACSVIPRTSRRSVRFAWGRSTATPASAPRIVSAWGAPLRGSRSRTTACRVMRDRIRSMKRPLGGRRVPIRGLEFLRLRIGAAGFEPATLRPQTVRDTRLRHAPLTREFSSTLRALSPSKPPVELEAECPKPTRCAPRE